MEVGVWQSNPSQLDIRRITVEVNPCDNACVINRINGSDLKNPVRIKEVNKPESNET
jgi:hypothetical protein